MISHKNKFIFVHTPKTGGDSINSVLQPYSEEKYEIHSARKCLKISCSDFFEGYEKHTPLSQIYKNWKPEYNNLDEYYKFGVVRNPWDRAISWYFYRSNHSHFDKKTFLNFLPRRSCFNYFQVEGFKIKKMDYIIRFEYLQEDFNFVCGKIGLPRLNLPHRNKRKHKHYSEYYDDEMVRAVQNLYAQDIYHFGYKFNQAKI
jgi:hypothetical protein